MRQIFIASETYNGTTLKPNSRGDSGPFQVTQTSPSPIGEKWVTAMHDVLVKDYNINVPVVNDMHVINGPALSAQAQIFVDPIRLNRVSTSRALLKDRSSNLDVRLQATVSKILIENKRRMLFNIFKKEFQKKCLPDKVILRGNRGQTY